ncbi:TIGR01458 family HAD-type hydrolase [Thiocapsa bogorovii]|uniref:TIGR01458 family HAD-type hydrolase n=1 Tax=Thiocapsa bogorovii TaxID=521689 RepID=UPI001E571B19|nr:TIGR01458 family HAD-type hydrolase [Thiocapsa bogorovii]UHD15554.1 TIGR01458 family HAD-type hydrolase [Thiocapsa bogorovii]
MNAILIDLDGVLYQGDEPIQKADQAIAWVRRRAIPHLYVTNTTSRPRAAIVDKLARLGIAVEADEILTPPLAASAWLAERGLSRVALFVNPATRADFTGVTPLPPDAEEGAEAVILGDLGEDWDYATLNRAFRLLMAEPSPQLIALGMTRYWRAPDGLRLDTAPFVAALKHATGVEPIVLGKPARPFFEAALTALGSSAADTLMIGDDIRSDIAGAQAAGLKTLLVRTGKFRPADLDTEIRPDGVIDSIADLPAWWQRADPAMARS